MKTDWHVSNQGRYVVNADGWTVAQFTNYEEAQLCAAAPVMRAALEKIAAWPDYHMDDALMILVKDALAACEVRKEQS